MLRAGSAEIPVPDNDILLAAEQALFAEEHATMEKMRELHEINRDVKQSSNMVDGSDFIRAQLTDCQARLIFIRRSLSWVRSARVVILGGGGTYVK